MNRRLSSPMITRAPHELGARPVTADPFVADLLERATAEAYERGRAAGVAEAHDSAVALAGRTADALRTALAAGLEELRAHTEQASRDTLELALAVAESVMGREPSDGGTALANRLTNALVSVDDGSLTVAVPAEEAEVVAVALADCPGVEVRADARLAPGEAKIMGRWATLDLTRATLMTAVREVFDDPDVR